MDNSGAPTHRWRNLSPPSKGIASARCDGSKFAFQGPLGSSLVLDKPESSIEGDRVSPRWRQHAGKWGSSLPNMAACW